ncbi:GFA family protein [Rhizobiales bacterium]|uniref:GFA family protein n=1 Tax=Hongsoonwoonella zoysiae TaxID=2821844 RepID=UPI0015611FEF|nr:GFA family protein [Hongsoonwoonella zoysiae]NRG17155.1 GFA family protein [Hongsoonwoonella zoysiae]
MSNLANELATEITGRCYCGATQIRATRKPTAVAYCHCTDCRRATGAPVAAFAAFDETAVTFDPNEGRSVNPNPGVTRTFCATCGSTLAGRYAYLPGQVYIALGLLDQADDLPPQLHAHEAKRLKWLHIDDDLERIAASSRSQLLNSTD